MPKDCRAMILDVKRAFLYGETKRDIYIELPPEDPMYGKGLYRSTAKSYVRYTGCTTGVAGDSATSDGGTRV